MEGDNTCEKVTMWQSIIAAEAWKDNKVNANEVPFKERHSH